MVEDEVDLADAVARGLRREGYAVDVAFDGDEALEKLALNAYDLVCLDLTLPEIDGREVCRRIRADELIQPQPRVLMLTARDALEDRVVGLDDGADDYLVKPFAFPELTARVRSLLRRDTPTESALYRGRRPRARHCPPYGAARRPRARPHGQGVRAAAVLHGAPRRGAVAGDLLEHVWDEFADPFTNTVRVTVGTLAPQAHRRGRGAADRDRHRQRLPA